MSCEDEKVEAVLLRDTITRMISLHDLQLLYDFGVDGDLYRLDPECYTNARSLADQLMSTFEAALAPPQPARTTAAAATLLLDALGNQYDPKSEIWAEIVDTIAFGREIRKIRGSDGILIALRVFAQRSEGTA